MTDTNDGESWLGQIHQSIQRRLEENDFPNDEAKSAGRFLLCSIKNVLLGCGEPIVLRLLAEDLQRYEAAMKRGAG